MILQSQPADIIAGQSVEVHFQEHLNTCSCSNVDNGNNPALSATMGCTSNHNFSKHMSATKIISSCTAVSFCWSLTLVDWMVVAVNLFSASTTNGQRLFYSCLICHTNTDSAKSVLRLPTPNAHLTIDSGFFSFYCDWFNCFYQLPLPIIPTFAIHLLNVFVLLKMDKLTANYLWKLL